MHGRGRRPVRHARADDRRRRPRLQPLRADRELPAPPRRADARAPARPRRQRLDRRHGRARSRGLARARDSCATETNRGFAAACNAGIAAGDGDVVVLLNNDVDCRPGLPRAPRRAAASADPRSARWRRCCMRPDGSRSTRSGLTVDAHAGRLPAPAGPTRSPRRRPRRPVAARARRRRGRLPPRRVGGGRRPRRADLRLRRGPRPRAAPARRGLGRRPRRRDAIGVHLGSATHGHRSARQRHARRLRARLPPAPLRAAARARRRAGGAHRGARRRRRRARSRATWPRPRPPRGLARSRSLRRASSRPRAIDHAISLRDAIALRRGVYPVSRSAEGRGTAPRRRPSGSGGRARRRLPRPAGSDSRRGR